MGELEHGTYDDEREGLTHEEVNALFGFEEDGEPIGEGDDQDDSDSDPEEQKYYGDNSYEKDRVNVDPDIEVCFT